MQNMQAGHNPSWMACRVMENAPLMMDWLAITVAIVARPTSAICKASGQRRKRDRHQPSIDDDGGLTGIIEQQRRQHQAVPRNRIGRGPK